ncbi:MAG: site-specific DNA-methyltransferase [Candidatus Izimaplasma sp.]|nr:site-specific DNA-methyltransferase [Candidatus Izimaplasma bacterium]
MYFKNSYLKLYQGDLNRVLSKIKTNTIDMIFADPPYFLSSDGITCKSGKMKSVNKANWDKTRTLHEKHKFNKRWIRKCKRVLKDNGTIFISGTYHNIYSIGMALEENGFVILNNIVWKKTNPPPNLSCRYFTHSTETILWAKKSKNVKHTFNYSEMKKLNNNKQMKDFWDIPTNIYQSSCINKKEKKHGSFPTQKPLALIERLVLSASNSGDIILDPFNGSGTTGVASVKNGRKYIGIDKEEEYLNLTLKRLKDYGV